MKCKAVTDWLERKWLMSWLAWRLFKYDHVKVVALRTFTSECRAVTHLLHIRSGQTYELLEREDTDGFRYFASDSLEVTWRISAVDLEHLRRASYVAEVVMDDKTVMPLKVMSIEPYRDRRRGTIRSLTFAADNI